MNDDLVHAEQSWIEGNIKTCFLKYEEVARVFEQLNDFETASYFYKRCLDISVDNKKKYPEGEPKAY